MFNDNSNNYIITATKCTNCIKYIDDILYKLIWDNQHRDLLCFNCFGKIANKRHINLNNIPWYIEPSLG